MCYRAETKPASLDKDSALCTLLPAAQGPSLRGFSLRTEALERDRFNSRTVLAPVKHGAFLHFLLSFLRAAVLGGRAKAPVVRSCCAALVFCIPLERCSDNCAASGLRSWPASAACRTPTREGGMGQWTKPQAATCAQTKGSKILESSCQLEKPVWWERVGLTLTRTTWYLHTLFIFPIRFSKVKFREPGIGAQGAPTEAQTQSKHSLVCLV